MQRSIYCTTVPFYVFDVRLSQLNKDYLLTYLLTYLALQQTGTESVAAVEFQ